MIDNGIDWIRLLREWWPVFTCLAGWGIGFHLNRFYTLRHLRAQYRQISNLELANAKLADESQRIIDYTNDLITKHNLEK